MKKSFFILLMLLLVLTEGCSKPNTKAMVVRDCTGVYLNIDGKDYRVCNIEKLSKYKHGQEVTVSYKTISSCDGSANDQVVCFMLHPYESWIEIKKAR